MDLVTTVNPHGFGGTAALCDEYYSWNDPPTGKVRGFVFWFEDCFQPPLYFVPMEEPHGSQDLSLQEALEVWIDYLYTQKSGNIIAGGYEGSQSIEQWAREQGTAESATDLTFGASFYAIPSESWKCQETWIEASGLQGAEDALEALQGRIESLMSRLSVSHPAHYEQLTLRPFQPEAYSLTAAQDLHTELTELLAGEVR